MIRELLRGLLGRRIAFAPPAPALPEPAPALLPEPAPALLEGARRPPQILPDRLDEALARLRAENPAPSAELPSDTSD